MSLKKIMLMTAMMAAAAQSDMFPEKAPRKGMSFNPDYKPQSNNRELREFTVKGQKIMAYSKKDAVTKLRHQKK